MLSPEELISYKRVAVKVARAAGHSIVSAWNQPRNIQEKSGATDLVTETDQACENLIFSSLKEQFPDHKFIGEEDTAANGAADLTDAPTWIVDPVDGTTNFVHGFPNVCVCIGLTVNKQPMLGVVYNPILKELFTAIKGQGAELNGVPITVSQTKDLGKALIATEIGTTRDDETMAAVFDRVQTATAATRSLRCTGSAALNMTHVAAGRVDAYYEIGFGGPWDVCAAAVVVTEAGGVVLDPSGCKFDLMAKRVLCGTPDVAAKLAELLKKCKTSSAEPGPPSA